MRLIKHLMALALACWAIAPFIGPPSAHALEFKSTGFTNSRLPQPSIILDPRSIELSSADISLSSSALSTDDKGNLLINASSCQPGERKIKGSATYVWRSCGTDSPWKIDAHLTLDEITVMNPYKDVRDASILLLADGFGVYDNPKQGGASLQATAIRPDGKGGTRQDPQTRLGVSVRVWLRFVKAGTLSPASGTFVFSMRGLNGVDAQMPAWSERVDLIKGFSGTVYGERNGMVSVSPDATSYTAMGGDEESYDAGFAVLADHPSMTFRWRGRGTRQLILDNFAPANAVFTHNGHGRVQYDGRIIGQKYPMNWESGGTFYFLPDACYDYPYASIDGFTPQKTSGKWTHERFILDTTFDLEFPPLSYQFRYEPGKAGGAAAMGIQSVVGENRVTVKKCTYTFAGHTFLGWSTNESGEGPLYLPGQQIGGLGTVKNKTVSLYAIWEPIISVRVPTVALCTVQADGSVTPPDNWVIVNNSPCEVTASIASSGVKRGIGIRILNAAELEYYRIEPDGTVGSPSTELRIARGGRAPCTWMLRSDAATWGTIEGDELQRLLPDPQGISTIGNVRFTFEQAR